MMFYGRIRTETCLALLWHAQSLEIPHFKAYSCQSPRIVRAAAVDLRVKDKYHYDFEKCRYSGNLLENISSLNKTKSNIYSRINLFSLAKIISRYSVHHPVVEKQNYPSYSKLFIIDLFVKL